MSFQNFLTELSVNIIIITKEIETMYGQKKNVLKKKRKKKLKKVAYMFSFLANRTQKCQKYCIILEKYKKMLLR